MTMEPGSTRTLSAIPLGGKVVTSDGKEFAHVKSVRGSYFELDVPMARDFWLSSAYASELRGSDVVLNITKDEVDAHRLDAPGIEPAQQGIATGDRVIDEGQALGQRERMERELAAQRERMGIQPENSGGTRDPNAHTDVPPDDEVVDAVKDHDREAKRAAMMNDRDAGLGTRI